MDVLDSIDQPTEDLDLGTQDDQSAVDTTQDDDSQQALPDADKVDGRRFNPEWSKALKELRELYPDRADMLTKLRDTYGRYGALTEIAPKGLEDVRSWKTTIDAVGGPEAAAELMQRAATMDQVDAKIEAGDFSVIGELPESLQKGFYQMLPDALSDLQTKNPQAFEAAVAPHFQAALLGTGMGDHLKKMYAAAGDNEPLKELIKQQYDWFQQQTQGAGKMGGQKSADPQVARLQAELDKHRKTDDDSFVNGVVDTSLKYVKDSFSKESAVYLKTLGLSDTQKADLLESYEAKVTAKLEKDEAFQKQLKAYKTLKNRNPEQVNTYIQSKVDEHGKTIMDALVTSRYPGGNKQKAASTTTGTNTTDNGATRVAQAPGQEQWDMAKMEALGYENTVKKGVFHLSGGRTVQLVRQ